jgi:type II secretory pathway pseudopilin PulG
MGNRKKGFSLLELLIYMALLAMILPAVAAIFLTVNSGRVRNEVRSAVDSNLRFAVDEIGNDVRSATSVTVPANGASLNSLTLITASGTVTYCVASGTLWRTATSTCTGGNAITDNTVFVATSTFTLYRNTNSILGKTYVSVQADLGLTANGNTPDQNYSEETVTTLTPFTPITSTGPVGLVGYWHFNEGSGSSTLDASGNGHIGTLENSPTWTSSGKINGALSFNGTNNDVKVSGLMGSSAAVTLVGWANLTSADSNGAELISIGDVVVIRLDGSYCNNLQAAYQTSAGSWQITCGKAKYAGTGWHHFAYVANPASSSEILYVDGVQQASSVSSTPIFYSGAGTDTYIGTHGHGAGGFHFNGIIDEVRIYSRALSAVEVSAIYNAEN